MKIIGQLIQKRGAITTSIDIVLAQIDMLIHADDANDQADRWEAEGAHGGLVALRRRDAATLRRWAALCATEAVR